MSHAIEQHQPGALDRASNGTTAERAHQLVGLPVNDDGGRADLAVVTEQAAAAEDCGEVAADARGIVGPVVALERLGPDAFLGGRITGAARDSRYPDSILDDRLGGRALGLLQDGEQLLDARRRQQW